MVHKGAVKPAAIEQRFAIRVRIRVPPSGLQRLSEMHRWLDQRVGRTGYRIWSDRHAPHVMDTTAVFLDDLAVATELVREFDLDLAPDPSAQAHS